MKALASKEESTFVASENILVEQLREKPGGQLVEATHTVGDKVYSALICELPSEVWVLVAYAEKAQ